MDLRGLCDYFDTQLSTSTSSVSSEVRSETFRDLYEHTLYLGDKEASAMGILALFMGLVRGALQERHPTKKFYVDHELEVLRFSSDAAIDDEVFEDTKREIPTDVSSSKALIVARTGQKRMDVVFSLQYKPKVLTQLKDQNPPFHISELFLQAFYLATQCEHAIVHCLTDLEDYHMF